MFTREVGNCRAGGVTLTDACVSFVARVTPSLMSERPKFYTASASGEKAGHGPGTEYLACLCKSSYSSEYVNDAIAILELVEASRQISPRTRPRQTSMSRGRLLAVVWFFSERRLCRRSNVVIAACRLTPARYPETSSRLSIMLSMVAPQRAESCQSPPEHLCTARASLAKWSDVQTLAVPADGVDR